MIMVDKMINRLKRMTRTYNLNSFDPIPSQVS